MQYVFTFNQFFFSKAQQKMQNFSKSLRNTKDNYREISHFFAKVFVCWNLPRNISSAKQHSVMSDD